MIEKKAIRESDRLDGALRDDSCFRREACRWVGRIEGESVRDAPNLLRDRFVRGARRSFVVRGAPIPFGNGRQLDAVHHDRLVSHVCTPHHPLSSTSGCASISRGRAEDRCSVTVVIRFSFKARGTAFVFGTRVPAVLVVVVQQASAKVLP